MLVLERSERLTSKIHVKWWLTCTRVLYNSWMSKLSMFRRSFSLQSSQFVMPSRFVPERQKSMKIKITHSHRQDTKLRKATAPSGVHIPEEILEQSHLLMQSWWTYCRLPVQRQGWIRGLDSDSSPIWQIRHRSPSSSSESSSNNLLNRWNVQSDCPFNSIHIFYCLVPDIKSFTWQVLPIMASLQEHILFSVSSELSHSCQCFRWYYLANRSIQSNCALTNLGTRI